MTPEIRQASQRLLTWAKDEAFPIWWAKGADRARGGFFELLGLDGTPAPADRRARVQARQIYCFARAPSLGWSGPAEAAVEHGLSFFLERYRRADGLFRTLVHESGACADDTAWLYDQAFALLALCEAYTLLGREALKTSARDILTALQPWRLTSGGFRESDPHHPFQSNPHMHLFEAAMGWSAVDEDPCWSRLADEIAELALTRFLDASGAVHEFFQEDWTFEDGEAGRIAEPGHQFEWCWLLERWSRMRSRADAHAASSRLLEIGMDHGVDRQRNVAFDQMLDDFSILNFRARLWPQTERIKAALIHSAEGDAAQMRFSAETLAALAGLETYLQTPLQGLWRDKLEPDGVFLEEPAPASSFYHIVCALAELKAASGL